jgi:hypothetical protein
MTASFKLTLDTEAHVAAQINHGNPTTEKERVTLELSGDPDLAEMKIWGDINLLDPGAEHIGETELDAEWQPYSEAFLLNLSANPGEKTLHVKVRDDVWNEATASASIRLGEEVIPPPPPPRPTNGPPTKPPRQRQRPERRSLRTSTTLRVAARSAIGDIHVPPRRVDLPLPTATFTAGRASQRLTGPLKVATTVGGNGAVGHRSPVAVGGARHERDIVTALGPEMQATLEALGVL